MAGITQPHCKALGEQLKGSGPADDKAWDTAACHAACLNELSYLLMDDGRCPDGAWAGAVKSLREGSAAALKAAHEKDLDATKAGFKQATESCTACHKARSVLRLRARFAPDWSDFWGSHGSSRLVTQSLTAVLCAVAPT